MFSNLSFHEGFVDSQLKISVYTPIIRFLTVIKDIKPKFFCQIEQLTLKDLMSLKVGDYITYRPRNWKIYGFGERLPTTEKRKNVLN